MGSTEESRRASIAAALKEHAGSGPEMKVPWKGLIKQVPVIRLRLSEVLLNHSSHRIVAQLESLPDWPDLSSNPEGEAAQRAIADAIRQASSGGYEDILVDLQRVGQQQPGVITPAGILINGNTRAVALRELKQEWIEVGVLPVGASAADLAEVEFKLQLPKDLRQPYTYTNTLLFIQELLTRYNYTAEKVALEVGFISDTDKSHLAEGVAKVEESTKSLELIRSLQDRCNRLTARRIPLTWFDDKQQSIEEMIRALDGPGQSDADVEELKALRSIGLLAGVVKLNLREIKANFAEEFLIPAFEDSEELGSQEIRQSLISAKEGHERSGIPGLSNLGEPLAPSARRNNFEGLLDEAARSFGRGEVEIGDGPVKVTMNADDFRSRLKVIFDEATSNARSDRLTQGSLEGPIKSLRDAVRNLEQAEKRLQTMASRGLNLEKFKSHLGKAERRMKSLRRVTDALGRDPE